MASALGFFIVFAVTLVLLGVALVSGTTGRRRWHLVAGPLAMVSLAVAIVYTEQLVRNYVFAPADLRFHLLFAKTAAGLGLLVIATGVWLWRRPAARRWHRLAVWLFVAGALAATATGFWLFGRASPQ